MKRDMWIIYAVTAAFLGFLMGYGVPPMQEVGIAAVGGHGEVAVEKAAETDAVMEQFEELRKLTE